MPRDLQAYQHGTDADVPLPRNITEHREWHQRMWTSLQSMPVIRVQDLDHSLLRELSMTCQDVISGCIRMYLGCPSHRIPELRSWYRGRLVPERIITESIASALATTATSEYIKLTHREELYAKKDGFPDPKGTASLFFRLIYLRVMKKRTQETAAMFGRSVGQVRAYGGGRRR